jgi:cobalt-zinc-cadmium efflux system outer membrane protein
MQRKAFRHRAASGERRPGTGGRPAWRRLAAVLLVTAAGPSLAQEAHVHVPLTIDPSMTWTTVMNTALDAYPRRVELAARENEAAALTERGKGVLAGAPTLYFSHLTDASLDNNGQREYEGGIELPVWHAGQRRALTALAGTAGVESSAAADALRWEVAGQLRAVLWDIASAANAADRAKDSVAVAEELLSAVQRRNARGDLPLADVLLAQSALLEKQKSVIETRASLFDAERTYRSLTGLDARPQDFSETRSAREDFDASHPVLALGDAELARAKANLELVDRETHGNMLVTVGPRRQRDAQTALMNNSFAVGVTIPIGGKSIGAPDRARAARAVAEAESRRGQLLRQLDLDLHEAEHTLSVVDESLALADTQSDLAMQQWQMAKSAFAQGEIELRDLLRIQDSAQNTLREASRLRIEHGRQIAAINQALGETP